VGGGRLAFARASRISGVSIAGIAANVADRAIQVSAPHPRRLRGHFYRPVKVLKSLRIDADVLDYFQRQGPGYQTRIHRVLRASMLRALRRRGRQGSAETAARSAR